MSQDNSQLNRAYPIGIMGVMFYVTADSPLKRGILELWTLCGNYLERFSQDTHRIVLFDDEVRRLSLTPDEERELVRRVIDGMLVEWTQGSRGQYVHCMWAGAIVAARRYFPRSDLLRRLYLVSLTPIGVVERWPQCMLWEIADGETASRISYPIQGRDFESSVRMLRDFLVAEFEASTSFSLQHLYAAWVQMVCARYAANWADYFILPFVDHIEIGGRRVADSPDIQRMLQAMIVRSIRAMLFGHDPVYRSYIDQFMLMLKLLPSCPAREQYPNETDFRFVYLAHQLMYGHFLGQMIERLLDGHWECVRVIWNAVGPAVNCVYGQSLLFDDIVRRAIDVAIRQRAYGTALVLSNEIRAELPYHVREQLQKEDDLLPSPNGAFLKRDFVIKDH